MNTPGRDLFDTRPVGEPDRTSDLSAVFDLLTPPEWHARAACRDHPEINWIPDRGQQKTELQAAKAVCDQCPVRDQCADWVNRHNDSHLLGIWAGTTWASRQKTRRNQPPPPCTDCGTTTNVYPRRQLCEPCHNHRHNHGTPRPRKEPTDGS
jgi:WhiB family redox-sensing transcriptional regulator